MEFQTFNDDGDDSTNKFKLNLLLNCRIDSTVLGVAGAAADNYIQGILS